MTKWRSYTFREKHTRDDFAIEWHFALQVGCLTCPPITNCALGSSFICVFGCISRWILKKRVKFFAIIVSSTKQFRVAVRKLWFVKQLKHMQCLSCLFPLLGMKFSELLSLVEWSAGVSTWAGICCTWVRVEVVSRVKFLIFSLMIIYLTMILSANSSKSTRVGVVGVS